VKWRYYANCAWLPPMLVYVAITRHVQRRYRSRAGNANARLEPRKTRLRYGELLALPKREFHARVRRVPSRSSRACAQAIQSKCPLRFHHLDDVRSQTCGRHPLLQNSNTIRSLLGRAFRQFPCPACEVRGLATRPHHRRNSRD